MGKRWKDLKFKHPWWACSLQYGVLFLLVLVGHVVSSMANIVYFRYPFDDFGYPFNFSYPFNETFRHPFNVTTNLTINNATTMYADNARSILCTLVESEAAIVAIVVSLTLIAIQFTASEYSPRVIDISLRNPDMWILLLIYGMSIFYGLVLIKQVPHDYMIPFEDFSLAFWLGVFSYAALVPYIWNISNLLKPENIIERLSAAVTKKKTLKYITYMKAKEGTSEEGETSALEEQIQPSGDKIKEATKEDEIRSVEDPVQPIIDIILRALMNHDIATTREGVEKIVEQAIEIINSEGGDEEEEEKKITEHFCKHLQRVGRLALNEKDVESTIEVIENLKKFGKATAKKGHGDAVQEVVKYSEKVGKTAAEKELYDAAWQAVVCLGDVGKTAAEKELYDAAWQAVVCLEDVGKTAAYVGEKLESVVSEVVFSLKAVGIAAVEHATKENGLESLAVQAAKSLGVIGKTTANVGLKKAKEQAILALNALEAKAKKKRLNGPEKQAVSSRSGIERTAMNGRKKSLKMRHGKQHRFK